jgi:hypothetical protein
MAYNAASPVVPPKLGTIESLVEGFQKFSPEVQVKLLDHLASLAGQVRGAGLDVAGYLRGAGLDVAGYLKNQFTPKSNSSAYPGRPFALPPG